MIGQVNPNLYLNILNTYYLLIQMQKIDCIYIINLEKRKTRLKRTFTLLADEYLDIPIKVFKATYWDSKEFKENILNKKVKYSKQWKNENTYAENDTTGYHSKFRPISMGQIACCYSHLQLLEDVIKNDYKTILMLQDDVFFEEEGQLRYEIDKFHNIISKHNDFDLYYMGKSKVWTNAYEEKFRDTSALVTEYCWNAHCIIFSQECCKKLLNTKIYEEMIPFDEFLPLCFGKSSCENVEYFKNVYPKIITALSTDTFDKIIQRVSDSTRYPELYQDPNETDIIHSPYMS